MTPTKDDVFKTLQGHADELHAAGVESVYLFGSVARGDAGPDSDVDLFFEYRPSVRGLAVIGLYQQIEDLFEGKTDVVARKCIHPALRSGIEADAVRVI